MASCVVRIREEDKTRLERLRHAILRATRAKPTQQEAVRMALEFALRHRAEFLADATWTPLTPKQFRRWVAMVEQDEGSESVPPEQVDDVVYGGR